MAQVAIRTEKLVHTYPRGNVMALKGVDLEIYVGDILSIVGQNGSGKTTLVRHFNGLLRPTSGKVYLMGEDTTGQTVAQMSRRCGYVFQNPNHQIFCTTVREELMVAPKNFGFSEQETQESLNRAFLNAGMLKRAQVEPPQITQLDLALQGGKAQSAALSVEDFVRKYKS